MTTALQIPGLSAPHQDTSSQFINKISNEDLLNDPGWLSEEFSRLPFQLHRIWLVFTILLIQFVNYHALTRLWSELQTAFSSLSQTVEAYEPALVTISCTFLFFGCVEMFFAIEWKKSELAQTGVLKYQYSLGILAASSLYLMWFQSFDFSNYSALAFFISFGLPVMTIANWIGGNVVLRCFQMNHPLARQKRQNASQVSEEDQSAVRDDFLAQNQIIAEKLLEYDLRLERWPYLIYKWWLKFGVVLEITMFPQNFFYKAARTWQKKGGIQLLMFLLPFLAHIIGAYCCYDAEVALRTRSLTRSKRVLSQLKICLLLSIVFSIAVPLLTTQKDYSVEKYLLDLRNNALNLILIPLLAFIGALNAHKIIKERDDYAKASNFLDECYET